MTTLIAATMLLGLATSPPEPVDFQLGSAIPSLGRPSVPLQPTIRAPLMLAPAPAEAAGPPDLPVPPHPRHMFSTARGFGHQVPLNFAVRQVVPPGVTVSYGHGVQMEAAVDWDGGAPWNRVLMKAVGPLGYRVVTGPRSVLIAME